MSAANHDARISGVEAETRELRRAVDVLFGKMDAQGAKLDAITSALHELRGSSGPALRDILSFVRDGAVLFSLVVAGPLPGGRHQQRQGVGSGNQADAAGDDHRHGHAAPSAVTGRVGAGCVVLGPIAV